MAGYTNLTVRVERNQHASKLAIDNLEALLGEDVPSDLNDGPAGSWSWWEFEIYDADSDMIERVGMLVLKPLTDMGVRWRAAIEQRDDFEAMWWEADGSTGYWTPLEDFIASPSYDMHFLLRPSSEERLKGFGLLFDVETFVDGDSYKTWGEIPEDSNDLHGILRFSATSHKRAAMKAKELWEKLSATTVPSLPHPTPPYVVSSSRLWSAQLTLDGEGEWNNAVR